MAERERKKGEGMFSRKIIVLLLELFLLVQVTRINAVGSAPVATFTYTPSAPIPHQTIVFDASASYDPDGGKIQSYMWDFGDETPIQVLADAVTYHNYTVEGTYNVTLTVTDDELETNSTWRSVTVIQYPVATFTYTPDWPIAGYSVTFNASQSTADGGTIVSYKWDFGDENVTTVNSPVIDHVYTTPRDYTVTLNVTDSEGLSDTESKLVKVRGIPVADFTHSPERPIINELVTFNASLSTPNGGNITSYFWDFGDETNGTGIIFNHTYTKTGSYTVTLTIKDSENLTDTAQDTFTVRDYPVALFEYKPKLPLVNEMVIFNASQSTANGGTIVSYEWDFGDRSDPVIEVDPIANHTYIAFGTYNVTLTITDSEDLTDTLMETIRILIHPVASFTYSPTRPIINETVIFNASASRDPDRHIANYTWNFNDGTPILITPNNITSHSYTVAKTYNVTLTVTDDDGLTNTVWKLITVYTFLYTHDVAVVSVVPSVTHAYFGQVVDITVAARNEGNSVETFNVTVYYGTTKVETKTVTYALPGSETTLVFHWDTTDVPYGNYTITANATLALAVDDDPTDNTRDDFWVVITIAGDASGDGWTDGEDLVMYLAPAFNSKEGDPNWNPKCDFNEDECVDGIDLVLYLAPNFGKAA